MFFISFVVLSEYGVPFWGKNNNSFFNKGKLWDAKSLIKESAPIILKNKNNNKAVLLVHDYAGTPYNLKELAISLFNENYDIYIPLLPGHGTNIDDFIKTDIDDWANLIKKAYEDIKLNYEKIIGIGLYTGGSILLQQLIENNINLKALILINSPIMILGYTKGSFFLPDIRLFFSGILRHFINDFSQEEIDECVLNNYWQGYKSFKNLNQLHFLKINLRKVKKHIFKIKIPILLICNNNKKVPIQNLNYIFEHANSKYKEKFIIEDSYYKGIYLNLNPKTKKQIINKIKIFIKQINL